MPMPMAGPGPNSCPRSPACTLAGSRTVVRLTRSGTTTLLLRPAVLGAPEAALRVPQPPRLARLPRSPRLWSLLPPRLPLLPPRRRQPLPQLHRLPAAAFRRNTDSKYSYDHRRSLFLLTASQVRRQRLDRMHQLRSRLDMQGIWRVLLAVSVESADVLNAIFWGKSRTRKAFHLLRSGNVKRARFTQDKQF